MYWKVESSWLIIYAGACAVVIFICQCLNMATQRALFNVQRGYDHFAEKKIFLNFTESNTFFDISNEIHPMSNIDEKKYTTQILCSATGKNDWGLMTITYTTVGKMQSFGIKFIKFSCQTLLQNEPDINPSETGQPINALDILMKSHRCFAKRKCPARYSVYNIFVYL